MAVRPVKTVTIYDEICPWPYHLPYGNVQVAAPKKPRKTRTKRVRFSDVSALVKRRGRKPKP